MFFDKSVVFEAVKDKLTGKEKSDLRAVELALILALDDLSLRLKSDSMLTSSTVSVSSGDKTFTFSGASGAVDLESIFAITISSGTTKQVVQFIDQKAYLRDYETQTITAGVPEYFSIFASSFGSPTIKFERELNADATVTVYYFQELTPDTLSFSKSITPFVMGTLAYFYGAGTEQSAAYMQRFEKLIVHMRADDKFVTEPETDVELNSFDKSIKSLQAGYRNRRS